MKKIVLLLAILLLVGCSHKTFYLSDKYYHNGDYISVTSNDIKSLDNESYVLYIYNNYCNLPIHCENIFKDVMDKYKIDFLSMPFAEFKKTSFHNKVKYAPSIIIIKNNDIIAYLYANSDKDYDKYQNTEEFEKWLKEYIYLEKNN